MNYSTICGMLFVVVMYCISDSNWRYYFRLNFTEMVERA